MQKDVGYCFAAFWRIEAAFFPDTVHGLDFHVTKEIDHDIILVFNLVWGKSHLRFVDGIPLGHRTVQHIRKGIHGTCPAHISCNVAKHKETSRIRSKRNCHNRLNMEFHVNLLFLARHVGTV